MTIVEYVDRRDKLTNTLFIIHSDGTSHYVENHRMYTKEEFSKKYPLPLSLISHNGDSCDKSKAYLHTD